MEIAPSSLLFVWSLCYPSGLESVIINGHIAHARPPCCWYHLHCGLMEQLGRQEGSLTEPLTFIIFSITVQWPSAHCSQAAPIHLLPKRKRFSGLRPALAIWMNSLFMYSRWFTKPTCPSGWTMPRRIAPSLQLLLGHRISSSVVSGDIIHH